LDTCAFAAQGGDLGAGVSTVLGLRYSDRIIGLHLNFIPGSYLPHLEGSSGLAAVEEEFIRSGARWAEESGAYSHIQRTRPQTAAYALNDSPMGLAAWILEKFREWSDCGGDLYQTFSRDELLANVTLYWLTGTIGASCRMYFENRRVPLQFDRGEFVRPPCAIAHFPKEILFPPREWVVRGFNVGRKCLAAATLQPWNSLNFWPRTFGHSFAHFATNPFVARAAVDSDN
jgi:hypothetical protein